MKRKISLLAFTAAVLLAMTASPLFAPKVDAVPDFCVDCAQKCWNDANTGENNTYYWECVDERGDTQTNRSYCYDTVVIGYYNGCIAMFCNNNGCSITRKAPTSRPGAN